MGVPYPTASLAHVAAWIDAASDPDALDAMEQSLHQLADAAAERWQALQPPCAGPQPVYGYGRVVGIGEPPELVIEGDDDDG